MTDNQFTCGDVKSGKYQTHDWDDFRYSSRVGKKAAGDLIDGESWKQLPEGRGAEE